VTLADAWNRSCSQPSAPESTSRRLGYAGPGQGIPARIQRQPGPGLLCGDLDLPCPVYWLPCFEVAPGEGVHFAPGVRDFLPFSSEGRPDAPVPTAPELFCLHVQGRGIRIGLNNPKADALRRELASDPGGPRDEALLERQGGRLRNMWSTAGFFHMAGLSVAVSGLVGAGDNTQPPAVYTFDPVRVKCGADGVTHWSPDPRSRTAFFFSRRDLDRYPAAMTAALGALLAPCGEGARAGSVFVPS